MRNLSRLILGVSALLLTVLLLLQKVATFDLWFHLRAGEWLLAGGGFPERDPFAFTADQPWMNLSWAYQIPLALLHRCAGLTGLTIYNALLILAAFTIVGWEGRRGRIGLDLIAFLIALATLASVHRVLIRPEQVSLLFLALAVVFASRALAGSRRALWSFPPLLLLWVNAEALFPLGLGVLGAAGLEALRRIRRPEPSGIALRMWFLVGFVSIGATLLNPYGPAGASFPLQLFEMLRSTTHLAGQAIIELRAPFDPLFPFAMMLPFYALGVLLLAVMVLRLRRINLFHLILVIAFGFLACRSVRNIPLFALTSLFVMLQLLGGRRPRKLPALVGAGAVLLRFACGAGLLLIGAGVVSGGYYEKLGMTRSFGLGIDERLFPTDTAARLAASAPDLIMNDQAMGHYLIWSLRPTTRVFICGRTEVYSQGRVRQLQACLTRAEFFDRYAEQAGAKTALIGHRPEYLGPLLIGLARHPRWRAIDFDNAGVLFARVAPDSADLPGLTTGQLPDSLIIPPPERRSSAAAWFHGPGDGAAEIHLNRGLLLLKVGYSEGAAYEALQATRAAPWIPDAYNLLGAALIRAGRLERAREALKACLDLDDGYVEATRNLATVEMHLGNAQAAEIYLRRVKDLTPRDITILLPLGKALASQGIFDEAERLLKSARAAFPQDTEPLLELGHLRYRQARYREASRYYLDAANLGVAYQGFLSAALSLAADSAMIEAEDYFMRARAAAPNEASRAQLDSLRARALR